MISPSDMTHIEVGQGTSNNGDAFNAGRDAARQAISTIHRHPVAAVMVFASVHYDLGKVLQGIKSVFPAATIMGSTTAGEICNGYLHQSVVVSVLASSYLKVNCGLGRSVSKGLPQSLDKLIGTPALHPYFHDINYWNGLALKGKSVFGVLFSPGNTRHHASQSYEILEALKQKSLGRLPIFGGSSADDWRMEENGAFLAGEYFPDSVVLAVFETQLQYGIAMGHGFVPTASRATVTSADGHELLELDGEPAARVYARLTGWSQDALSGKHLTLTTGHTFGVSNSVGQYSINVASYATPAGGLNLTQPVVGGTLLTLMEPGGDKHPTAGLEALRKGILRGGITAPAWSMVAYCALTSRLTGCNPEEAVRDMRSLLGESPLVGFCSFGEQGVADDGTSQHNNAVISVLVLGKDLSAAAHVALENERLLNEMEERVRERTRELSAANDLLQHEVAERRQAEQTLRESEETLKSLMDLLPVGVRWSDNDGNMEYVNGSFQELFGYTLEEIPSLQVCYALFFPDREEREKLAVIGNAIIARAQESGTQPPPLEANITCKDGTLRRVIINSQLAKNRRVAIFTDITERENNQTRLLNAQRLESLGILAGGIAHDFNNILTGIMGNISFARMVLERPDKAGRLLEIAEKASLRAADLVNQLLTFAKGGSPVKKRVSVGSLVTESVSLALRGTNVKGALEIPDSLPDIEADEAQLRQVFNNICINAIQAMPSGGTLTVRAETVSLPAAGGSLPKGSIAISFADDGCGIKERDLKKIFDPYFSTKAGSTGIGLASVHSIVSRHGGQVNVQSAEGKGTTFTILLPSTEKPADEGGEKGADGSAVKNGVVLIMDDEEVIRTVAVEMVEFFGFQAAACCSGEEAVELYRSAVGKGAPFTAAIMDLTIPGGMGGEEAAQRILEIDPAAYLIVSSGYSNDPVVAQFGKFGFRDALVKPYKMAEMKKALDALH